MDENENLNETVDTDNEKLKKAIGDYLTKERGQSMILGFRVACKTILEMIAPCHQPKCAKREYERTFKKLEEFCVKALKQDEPDNTEETAQN